VSKTKQSTAPADKEKSGGGAVVATVLGLLVLVGGGWAAAYFLSGDELPHGTTVAGVEIGDQTSDEAAATLQEALDERTGRPITLVVDGEQVEVSGADAGLEVDTEATVAQAGGERSWDPRRLWDHYTGGDEVEPVVTLDEERVAKLAERIDQQAGKPARDGAVEFTATGVSTTAPAPGLGVDRDELREALTSAYVAEGDGRRVELDLQQTQPEIDEDDLAEARDGFANPAVRGPVTLVFGKTPVELSPRQYAPALTMRPEGGELVPALDEKALDRLVAGAVASDARKPVDATVKLVRGKPRVVPAKPGVTYDKAEIRDVFLDLVTKPEGQRKVTVEATVAEPDFTTEEARALGITQKVSSFSTEYPHADYRNVNIGRAAELIDGTVLKPGETFSLNDTVGERTAENGFTAGYIISDGVLKQDLGGGVSQMATTLYNAAFFAGLKDVEHKPHSFYIDRYPVGREATVAWGALDMRFQNDTKYGVLIDTDLVPSTYSRSGKVTVTMYSTKVWDIESVTSERYNYRAPATRVIYDDPTCEPHTGWSGFDVDVTRIFRKPGSEAVVKREKYHTAYTASDSVECRTTPKPPPSPQPDQPGQPPATRPPGQG